jgi:hypothetical protein
MYINVKRKNNYDDYEVTIRARFDTCAGAMGFIGRVESVEFEMPLPDKNEPYGRYRDDHVRVAVLAVAKSGEKVSAIKLYRHLSGLGLRESKDQVETWMRNAEGKSFCDEGNASHFAFNWNYISQ